METPYFHRTAVRDKRYFINRAKEVRRVLELVDKKQPVSIVGPRRIGKTSLLHYLCDSDVRASHGIDRDYIFVYVTCELLSGAPDKHSVYGVLLRHAMEVMPRHHNVEHDFRESMVYLDFKKRLEDITDSGLNIVFLLDEFEAIAGNCQLGKDLFDELRALGESDTVNFITASAKTLYDLSFHDKSILNSPFFNIFTVVRVELMEQREASNLIEGLAALVGFKGFDDNDYAFLLDIAGPHPFFLQVACNLLFEEKLDSFLKSAMSFLASAREALKQRQVQALRHEADTLRVISAGFGAAALTTLCEQLHNRAKGEGLEDTQGLFAQAEAEYEKILAKSSWTRENLEKAIEDGPIIVDYDRLRRRFADEMQVHFQYAWKHLDSDEQMALKALCEERFEELAPDSVKRLEQKCLMCQGRVFSSAFHEFVSDEIERTARISSQNTIEVTTETGEKKRVTVTKPPLMITDEDLRKFGIR